MMHEPAYGRDIARAVIRSINDNGTEIVALVEAMVRSDALAKPQLLRQWQSFAHRLQDDFEADPDVPGLGVLAVFTNRLAGYSESSGSVPAPMSVAAPTLPEAGLVTRVDLEGLDHSLAGLLGDTLSSVTFLPGAWQLGFGVTINVNTAIRVATESATLSETDERFRNLLCELIGSTVIATQANDDTATLIMGTGRAIQISVRAEDFIGPENVVFVYGNSTMAIY